MPFHAQSSSQPLYELEWLWMGIADMNTSRNPDQSIGFVEYGVEGLTLTYWHGIHTRWYFYLKVVKIIVIYVSVIIISLPAVDHILGYVTACKWFDNSVYPLGEPAVVSVGTP